MKHRNIPHPDDPRNSARPSVLEGLAELSSTLVLLLGVCLMTLRQGHVWSLIWQSLPSTTRTTSQHKTPSPTPLQWRGPWWAWQFLSWAITTVTAPTFLFIGSLLLINSRSDHPLFWWSLLVIVAIGNAAAIMHVNQQHHRKPYTDPSPLAWRYASIGMATNGILFLLVGWTSGFLPEVVAPAAHAMHVRLPALATVLWSALGAAAFGTLSFTHAGAVHVALAFRIAAAGRARVAFRHK